MIWWFVMQWFDDLDKPISLKSLKLGCY
jgi:hypothetical protein